MPSRNSDSQVNYSQIAQEKMKKLSRRGFMWAVLTLGGSYAGIRWIDTSKQIDGLPGPLRKTLNFNSEVERSLFNESSTSALYPASAARWPIVNGVEGIEQPVDASQWKLTLEDHHVQPWSKNLTLANIKSLPRHEFTTELRCVEGWATTVTWAGAKLIDFIRQYPPQSRSGTKLDFENLKTFPKYLGFQTPDNRYYVSIDIQSALHHQTLLCYSMNGIDLPDPHGGPLRLVVPSKYGYKSLKRIGKIFYSNSRPPDYWAELGYDWYAGL